MKTSRIVAGALVVALSAGTYGVAEAASGSKAIKVSTTKTTKVSLGTATNTKFGKGGFDAPDGANIQTVLDGLVTKGTITAAQETAILAALNAARPAQPAGGPIGFGGVDIQKVVTTTLGIDAATLQADLKAGQSLATIAGSKTAALITAIVTAESTAIDAAVTAGKLTAAQATTLKSGLVANVTTEVNETHPAGAGGLGGFGGFGGMGGFGGHGHGGPNGAGGMGGMGGNAPALGAPSTTAPSTNG